MFLPEQRPQIPPRPAEYNLPLPKLPHLPAHLPQKYRRVGCHPHPLGPVLNVLEKDLPHQYQAFAFSAGRTGHNACQRSSAIEDGYVVGW